MGKVNYDYDTAAIRREARRIRDCSNRMESSAFQRVKDARAKLEGNFEGRTADALDESLNQTQSKLKALNAELKALYSALMSFADALEEADEQIARILSK